MRIRRAAPGSPTSGLATVQITAAMLRRRFPGASVWHGEHTGSWWAMHPAVARLVEAASLGELAFALRAALGPAPPADGRAPLRAAS